MAITIRPLHALFCAEIGGVDTGEPVDDATFAALEKFFTPEEIVEISYTVGSYYATGLVLKALRMEIETDGRLTVG